MNAVEKLMGEVALLTRRIEEIERVNAAHLHTINKLVSLAKGDSKTAQVVAEQMGFSVEIVVLPERREARRALAKELKAKGWSHSRIARALNCCERSVERWTA